MKQLNNNQPLVSWKPNKFAFVYWKWGIRLLLTSFVISIVSLSMILLGVSSLLLLGFIIVYFFIMAFFLVNFLISYNKEVYYLYTDRFVQHGGSIFSDYQTELVIKNITHVDTIVPFIENFFLGTANVRIESAGSASSEIFLKSIDNYSTIEQKIKEAMQQNGFSLQKKNLLQNEHPSNVGIIISLISEISSSLFNYSLLFIASLVLSYYTEMANNLIFLTISFMFLVFIAGILRLLFLYLDLRRRTYQIFDDTIVYTEGFLTRHYSFIPIENLADSTIEQNLVFRLLGIYNIKLSCQGSGQEILFQYMRNGRQMESVIDSLISAKQQTVNTTNIANSVTTSTEVFSTAVPMSNVSSNKVEIPLPIQQTNQTASTDFTGEYKMDPVRSLVLLVLLIPLSLIVLIFNPIVALLFIYGGVVTVVSVFATKYKVNKDNIQENYKFLSVKEKKFTNNKITGIVVSENVIDWLFNTQSIKFWSIGSDASIQFKNIKKSPKLIPEVLKKLGITGQSPIYNIPAKLSISKYLTANIIVFGTSVVLLFSILLVLLFIDIQLMKIFLFGGFFILLPFFVLMYFFYIFRYANSQIQIFPDYVIAVKGFFFKKTYYTLLNNVKDIETIKYPFTNAGTIKFNIAGEELMKNPQESKSGMLISNHFKMEFVEEITDLDEIVDLIFRNRPKNKIAMQKIIDVLPNLKSQKPALLCTRPTLMNVLIFFIVFPPLWLFIPLVVWSVLVTSYQVESFRVVKRWGIIFKSQKSLIFKKIDFIDKKQGLLNKIFSNGTVSINTVGSSKTELEMNNIADYQAVYDIIKKHYK